MSNLEKAILPTPWQRVVHVERCPKMGLPRVGLIWPQVVFTGEFHHFRLSNPLSGLIEACVWVGVKLAGAMQSILGADFRNRLNQSSDTQTISCRLFLVFLLVIGFVFSRFLFFFLFDDVLAGAGHGSH